MSEVIPGLKLIRHNAVNISKPDDPSLPFKLEANFRPPEFMDFTFICLHGGSEEIVVRGETKDALDRFIELNNLRDHPRLRRMTMTGPDGTVEQIPEKKVEDSN